MKQGGLRNRRPVSLVVGAAAVAQSDWILCPGKLEPAPAVAMSQSHEPPRRSRPRAACELRPTVIQGAWVSRARRGVPPLGARLQRRRNHSEDIKPRVDLSMDGDQVCGGRCCPGCREGAELAGTVVVLPDGFGNLRGVQAGRSAMSSPSTWLLIDLQSVAGERRDAAEGGRPH